MSLFLQNRKVLLMRTGYWSVPSASEILCHSQLSRGQQVARELCPVSSHSSFPCSAGSIILPLLRAFQEASELPVSGQLDDATKARMRQPRCGVEDPFNQKTLKYLLLGED